MIKAVFSIECQRMIVQNKHIKAQLSYHDSALLSSTLLFPILIRFLLLWFLILLFLLVLVLDLFFFLPFNYILALFHHLLLIGTSLSHLQPQPLSPATQPFMFPHNQLAHFPILLPPGLNYPPIYYLNNLHHFPLYCLFPTTYLS